MEINVEALAMGIGTGEIDANTIAELICQAVNAIEGTLDGVDLDNIEYEGDTPTGGVDMLYAFDAVELEKVLTIINEVCPTVKAGQPY